LKVHAVAISVREAEIQKLTRFYRKSIRDLAQDFVAASDFEKPGVFGKLQQSFGILDDLEERTSKWADKNVKNLYLAASREAEKDITRMGLKISDIKRAKSFGVVNQSAINALLVDPEVGFLTGMQSGIDQIRDRMKSIQNQAKLLTRQQRLFDQTIARVGFLEGRDLNSVRDRLVNEMVSMKKNSDLLFTSKAAKLPPGQIIRDVADLPFVKIPDARAAAGFRRLRVDKYAELLARTKTAQASNLARRNKALEHDVELMQISRNKPLDNDACFLYIGKVFALTQGAKEEFGVPLLQELPNGGAPFHPHCTHQELQFVAEFATDKEMQLGMTPPPKWALNQPWSVVEKEFRRRGGGAAAAKFNKGLDTTRTTGGRERRRAEADLPPDDTGTVAPPETVVREPALPPASPLPALQPAANPIEEISKLAEGIRNKPGIPTLDDVATVGRSMGKEVREKSKTFRKNIQKADARITAARQEADRLGKIVDDDIARTGSVTNKEAERRLLEASDKVMEASIARSKLSIGGQLREEVLPMLNKVRPMGGKLNVAKNSSRKWVPELKKQAEEIWPTSWVEASNKQIGGNVLFEVVDERGNKLMTFTKDATEFPGSRAAGRKIHTKTDAEELATWAFPNKKFKIVETIDKNPGLRVRIGGTLKGTGGHYSNGPPGGEIAVKRGTRWGPDTRSGKGLLAHEMGHRMEDVVEGLSDLEREFYIRRTTLPDGTREPAKLLELKDGFPAGSSLRDDKFYQAGMHTNYTTRYMGRDYGNQKFHELLTRGVEGLFGYDETMAQFLIKDEEFLDWILGLLATV
jgi:hypothetical protein